jgi:aryl-alcohol dehydrogenase
MVTTIAAVLRDKGAGFRLEEVSVADPRPDEVLVRLVATGICHTDLLVRDEILPPRSPVVLGHEGSGVVERVGAGVTTLTEGDHVVLTPLSCGRCRTCLTGHPMHCAAWGPLNLRGRRPDGSTAYRDSSGAELNAHFFGQSSFAQRVVVSERAAIRVADEAPLPLLGPLGCGFAAGAGTVLSVLAPGPGAAIAVFGAGAVGLAGVLAAVVAGCTRIVVVDRLPERLDLAKTLGATDILLAGEDVVTRITELTGGVGYSLDAVGHPATARAAVDVLTMGGMAAIAGSSGAGQDVSLDLTALMGRTVRGVIEGDSVPALLIPRLIGLYQAGRFPFDQLVRTYPFDEINEAVADSESGRTVKPVLLHSPE